MDSGEWTWQVVCLQLETGKIQWTRDACVGKPAIKRHLKASHTNFVAILEIRTGQEIRRIERGGEVATWSTPLVVTTEDQEQVVCNGYLLRQ